MIIHMGTRQDEQDENLLAKCAVQLFSTQMKSYQIKTLKAVQKKTRYLKSTLSEDETAART